jgi:site-specific DNA-methyltransferase (adenine-specific)
MVEIIVGDCIESLRAMPAQSVHTCITSPPYFGLRDYGHDGQIGLEQTPNEFVAKLVEVFREVHRVLRDDGTLWLNLGDSYASTAPGTMNAPSTKIHSGASGQARANFRPDLRPFGFKPKDLIGIPWRVAFALQADGWYLRQDIIWHKPNPMPESVRDRCTKAHEYVFLLSKSERYYFDAEAIKEPVVCDRKPGQKVNTTEHYGAKNGGNSVLTGLLQRYHNGNAPTHRNRRSVWTVTTKPFKGAHFATFPPDLIEPCVLAGCPAGGVVLDPFGGAGTTGLVAQRHGRRAILCELNPEYAEMARARIDAETAPPKAKRATRPRVQQADLFGEVRA